MEVKLMDRYSWNSSKKPKGQGAEYGSSTRIDNHVKTRVGYLKGFFRVHQKHWTGENIIINYNKIKRFRTEALAKKRAAHLWAESEVSDGRFK